MSDARNGEFPPKARPAPDSRRLVERIVARQRISLRDAMRLRELELAPFRGATLFVLDDDDAVSSVGCTVSTTPVSVASVVAALQRRTDA